LFQAGVQLVLVITYENTTLSGVISSCICTDGICVFAAFELKNMSTHNLAHVYYY